MKVEQNSVPLAAVTVCGVQNLISTCPTYPAHWQGKHKIMAKNLNLKEKSIWVPYNCCCCEFLRMWVVVSPALQVTLSRVKKPIAEYRMGNWLATEVFLSQLAIRVPCISTQYWLM
jgi:hypothetical protein